MPDPAIEIGSEDSQTGESSTLIRLALAGCGTAWGILIDAQRSALHRVARILLPPRLVQKEAVSDLVGRTVGIAFEKRAKFQGATRAELAAWLRGILRKTAGRVSRYFGQDKRDVAMEIPLADYDPVDQGGAPAADAEQEELKTLVRVALAGLPERLQQVIHLRITENLSFPEIGRRINKDPAAVRMQFERALKTLRGSLGKTS